MFRRTYYGLCFLLFVVFNTYSRCARSCTFPWRICCRSSSSLCLRRIRTPVCNRSGTRTCICGPAKSLSSCWSSSSCGWCPPSCRWPERRSPSPRRQPTLSEQNRLSVISWFACLFIACADLSPQWVYRSGQFTIAFTVQKQGFLVFFFLSDFSSQTFLLVTSITVSLTRVFSDYGNFYVGDFFFSN